MTGWSCPSCNRCYAPHVTMCAACDDARPKEPEAKSTWALWTEWEEWARTRDDWATCRSHKAILSVKFQYAGKLITLGELPWPKCDLAVVGAWQMHMLRTENARHKLYSPSTVNRMTTTLQTMFSYHVEQKAIPRNPVAGRRRFDETDGERQGYLTEEQFTQFVDGAHPRFQQIMRTIYRCGGLRPTEARLLKRTEVDWDARVIVMKRNKGGKPKRIPVTDDVFPMLVALRETALGDYLFPNPRDPRGGPVPKGTFAYWAEEARKRSGLAPMGEPVVPYHARHGFAIVSLAKDMPSSLVEKVMGHAPGSKAAARYQRLIGDAETRARFHMNRRLSDTPPPVVDHSDRMPPQKKFLADSDREESYNSSDRNEKSR